MKYEVNIPQEKKATLRAGELQMGQAAVDREGMYVLGLSNGHVLRLGVGVVNGYEGGSSLLRDDLTPLPAGTIITITSSR